jgi:hypothetical protein
MTFLSEKTMTARKQHICEGCETEIEPGTPYVRYTGTSDDAGIYSTAYHVECRETEIELNHEKDLWGDDWLSLWYHLDCEGDGLLNEIQPIVADRLRLRAKRADERRAARLAALSTGSHDHGR